MKWVYALIAAAGLSISSASADHSADQDWLLSWIPATCCVTNNCCFESSFKDLTPLPDDHWKINATGQVLKRTGWSPDGKYWRCACDYDSEKGWVKHPAAFTRCIYPPMQGVSLAPDGD